MSLGQKHRFGPLGVSEKKILWGQKKKKFFGQKFFLSIFSLKVAHQRNVVAGGASGPPGVPVTPL
jgi:hypothetical protein